MAIFGGLLEALFPPVGTAHEPWIATSALFMNSGPNAELVTKVTPSGVLRASKVADGGVASLAGRGGALVAHSPLRKALL